MKLIDTHTHLTDDKYDLTPNELVEEFVSHGGQWLLAMSLNRESASIVLNVQSCYPNNVKSALGYHPESLQDYSEDFLDYIRANANLISAIGEIGLDYHYNDGFPKELQIKVFTDQLKLACELNKPVCIHCRDAYGDLMQILSQFPSLRGVIHCFSSSVEIAKELVKQGLYIGVGGSYTFKSNKKLKDVVMKIGLSHILLETDCPYLTPEPYRGTINKPHNVGLVATKIAQDLNMNVNDVVTICNQNAIDLFGE